MAYTWYTCHKGSKKYTRIKRAFVIKKDSGFYQVTHKVTPIPPKAATYKAFEGKGQ